MWLVCCSAVPFFIRVGFIYEIGSGFSEWAIHSPCDILQFPVPACLSYLGADTLCPACRVRQQELEGEGRDEVSGKTECSPLVCYCVDMSRLLLTRGWTVGSKLRETMSGQVP